MSVASVGVQDLVLRARAAVETLSLLGAAERAGLLDALAAAILDHVPELLTANTRDVDAARAENRSPGLIDRLRLTPARVESIVSGVRAVARMDDPLGGLSVMSLRPNGMLVGRMRVPLGVILMVYEARPNVTVDAAALCVKSGNAVLLRGGTEARHSNLALASIFDRAGFPHGAVQVIVDPDRGLVSELLMASGIDVLIPRGGEQLIRYVTERATMPVLRHSRGVCHLFVDREVEPAIATAVVINAKTQRPSTCNALETLLVDRALVDDWLPEVIQALEAKGVEIRGEDEIQNRFPTCVPATDSDWDAEYLDMILAVKIVSGLDEAIAHIRRHSSGLADGIITSNYEKAMRFVRAVDSAAVLVNASTRLVDGGEFGLGGEIGISTERIGPRGPMGLHELTTTKWVVLGNGQVR